MNLEEACIRINQLEKENLELRKKLNELQTIPESYGYEYEANM